MTRCAWAPRQQGASGTFTHLPLGDGQNGQTKGCRWAAGACSRACPRGAWSSKCRHSALAGQHPCTDVANSPCAWSCAADSPRMRHRRPCSPEPRPVTHRPLGRRACGVPARHEQSHQWWAMEHEVRPGQSVIVDGRPCIVTAIYTTGTADVVVWDAGVPVIRRVLLMSLTPMDSAQPTRAQRSRRGGSRRRERSADPAPRPSTAVQQPMANIRNPDEDYDEDAPRHRRKRW